MDDRTSFTRRRCLQGAALLLAAGAPLVAAGPLAAAGKAQVLVDESRLTIEELLADKDLPQMPGFVEQAKGILIFPQIVKGGFIIGGEGGSGVFLVRGADGAWSPPAFYTLAAASIGLQAGGQISQVIFTVMNEGAVDSILGSQFKLGADASVAIGPIGAGIEASTTANLNFDIYAFSRSAGLFAGGAFEGAALLNDEERMAEYYGAGATPRDIVLGGKGTNPGANALRRAIP